MTFSELRRERDRTKKTEVPASKEEETSRATGSRKKIETRKTEDIK